VKNPNAIEAFGNQLKKLRNLRGWSQLELADRASVPKITVQRIEKHKHTVGLGLMVSLARALEIPVKELLDIPGLEQMDRD
jgi:transcriptional regulator with XRE-family HTH domain